MNPFQSKSRPVHHYGRVQDLAAIFVRAVLQRRQEDSGMVVFLVFRIGDGYSVRLAERFPDQYRLRVEAQRKDKVSLDLVASCPRRLLDS